MSPRPVILNNVNPVTTLFISLPFSFHYLSFIITSLINFASFEYKITQLFLILGDAFSLVNNFISRDVAAKFVMILSLINVIICFYPSYTLTRSHPNTMESTNTTFNSTNTTMTTDDYVGNFGSTTVIYGASLSCLMISIPSACDCIIDMIPQWIVIALFKDKRYTNAQNQAKSHGDSAGIKMTIAERLMFIIGVITLSSATFPDLQVINDQENEPNTTYSSLNSHFPLSFLTLFFYCYCSFVLFFYL